MSKSVNGTISLRAALGATVVVAALLAFTRACIVHPAIVGVTLCPAAGFALPLLGGTVLLTVASYLRCLVETATAHLEGRHRSIEESAPPSTALSWIITGSLLVLSWYVSTMDWRPPIMALLASPAAWMLRVARNRRSRRFSRKALFLLSFPAFAGLYLSSLGPLLFVGGFMWSLDPDSPMSYYSVEMHAALHEPLFWIPGGTAASVWWSIQQHKWVVWGAEFGELVVGAKEEIMGCLQ